MHLKVKQISHAPWCSRLVKMARERRVIWKRRCGLHSENMMAVVGSSGEDIGALCCCYATLGATSDDLWLRSNVYGDKVLR